MMNQPSDSNLSAYEEAALDRPGVTPDSTTRVEAVGSSDALSDDVLPYSLAFGR